MWSIIAVADPWKVTQFSGTNSFQLILTLRWKSSSRFAAGCRYKFGWVKIEDIEWFPSVPAAPVIGTIINPLTHPQIRTFGNGQVVTEGTELGDWTRQGPSSQRASTNYAEHESGCHPMGLLWVYCGKPIRSHDRTGMWTFLQRGGQVSNGIWVTRLWLHRSVGYPSFKVLAKSIYLPRCSYLGRRINMDVGREGLNCPVLNKVSDYKASLGAHVLPVRDHAQPTTNNCQTSLPCRHWQKLTFALSQTLSRQVRQMGFWTSFGGGQIPHYGTPTHAKWESCLCGSAENCVMLSYYYILTDHYICTKGGIFLWRFSRIATSLRISSNGESLTLEARGLTSLRSNSGGGCSGGAEGR